jgi:phosphohistidine swiveling domain-containing protein
MPVAADASQPTVLEAPTNFPVSWPRAEDAAQFWVHNRMHFPRPLTAMDHEVARLYFEDGITAAGLVYDVPLRVRVARINSYFYMSVGADPGAMGGRPEEKLRAAMAGLDARWRDEHLPEIRRHLAFWSEFDLAGASMPALLDHFEETIARERRLLEVHFLVWYPMMIAVSSFHDLHHELFGGDDAFDAYKLLQGFESLTVAGSRALWRLSRRALTSPTARQVLEGEAAADVLPALAASADGRAFRAELDAYLAEYGQRGDGWCVSHPSWIEDPTPVLKMLKDYVGQPERDLDAELAAGAAERERLVAEARRRLADHPQAVRDDFGDRLRAAQVGYVLTEDHGFWIDFRCQYRVRRVLTEMGRRFTSAGVLDGPDDVFYLTLDEVRATGQALPRLDRRALIAGRAAEIAYFGTIAPPPMLGTLPSAPPPDDPVGRALGRFFGPPPSPSVETGVLRGTAASVGIVRAPARIIRSLADAGRLRPGEVLVAETTAPPWTPLFATAAAVVVDTGGVLSHCAVVAREFGIPAVVGVGSATTTIRDGQTVEVDGAAGVVRLL